MPFLSIRGLVKRFGALTAVDQLDLQISPGEIYVILGPNGAGKTTALRMISGITPPTAGSIVIDNLDLAASPTEAKSKFFFIPDRPYLYEKLTGREYLEFLINIYRRGCVESIQSLLAEFEMHDRLDHLVESYSHGMRQKLLLAAAFMLTPPLLVIDEPLVGLDPRSAVVLRNKMVDFVRDGRLALLSTHQLWLAEAIATRVGILHRAKLLAEGSPKEICARGQGVTLEEEFLRLTQH